MDFAFRGKVNNGKVVLDDPKGFRKHLMNLEGKIIQVIARKYKTIRSINQNKYYWGVVIKIAGDYHGYTPDEMHNAFKWLFLRKGGDLPTVKRTSDLGTIEFEKYLENIRIYELSEYQVVIPLPNEIDV